MTKARNLTNLEYALLALVNQAPTSGYELCKVFETTPIGHYSSSPGSIYPALKRLQARGFLVAEIEHQETMRPRRIFSVTDEGETELRRWVTREASRDELVHDEDGIMLRFAFMAGFVRRPKIIAFLRQLAAEVDKLVSDLDRHHRKQELAGSGRTDTGSLALGYGISAYRNLARWARRTARTLESS